MWEVWERRNTQTNTKEEGWADGLCVAEAKPFALLNVATKDALMLT